MQLIISFFRKFCLFFLFLFLPAFAAAKTDFGSLSVRSAEDYVFVHSESEFVLSVPDVEPDKLQTELLELPTDVRFISSKKEFDGNGGTIIRFWLYFSSVGNFELPPILLKRGFKVHYIPFGKITVTENPALVSPRLFAVIDKNEGFFAGESIFFTVYAQYAGQILDFSFKLPKDSIFFEKERLFSKKDEKKRAFSTEPVPIAKFEWKPLNAGLHAFPEMYMDAVSYSGNRKTVSIQKKEIDVSARKKDSEKKEDVFDGFYEPYVFSEAESEKSSVQTKILEEPDFKEECDELCALRNREKYSFPLSHSFSESVVKRKNLESMIGIRISENEKNFWVMNFLFVVTGVFLVMFVLFLSGRHAKLVVLFFSLFVISLFASFVYESEFEKRFGIFYGGSVSVIPEELGEGAGRFVPAGLRVKIIEKSSDWFYIETVDCSGWVKAELVNELM